MYIYILDELLIRCNHECSLPILTPVMPLLGVQIVCHCHRYEVQAELHCCRQHQFHTDEHHQHYHRNDRESTYREWHRLPLNFCVLVEPNNRIIICTVGESYTATW